MAGVGALKSAKHELAAVVEEWARRVLVGEDGVDDRFAAGRVEERGLAAGARTDGDEPECRGGSGWREAGHDLAVGEVARAAVRGGCACA